jgi:hypothetical protein
MGSVYLAGSKELGWYKIGYSTKDDPSDRIKTISKGTPFPMELVHSWVTTFHPEKLEAFLHQGLKGKQLRGEWFVLSNFDLVFCQKQAFGFLTDFEKQSLPIKRLLKNTNKGKHWTCSDEARQARSRRMKGIKPANLTMKGRSQSKEAKEKSSRSHKDFYINNPEGVAVLNAARPRGEDHVFFGRERPQETCDKIAASLKEFYAQQKQGL